MSDAGTDSTEQTRSTALDAIKAQRAALQSFYKLSPNNEATGTETEEQNKSVPVMTHRNSSSHSVVELDPSKIEDVNEFITTESYVNILKMENKVLDKLNSSKSEIKSIIYNNYYELIKINTILEGLLTPREDNSHLESISDNLAMIRENMEKSKSIDLDIFGDLPHPEKEEDTQASKLNGDPSTQ